MTQAELRPDVIAEIAHWWRECLDAAERNEAALKVATIEEVESRFRCSDEEAIRGICVGEQLHWGG